MRNVKWLSSEKWCLCSVMLCVLCGCDKHSVPTGDLLYEAARQGDLDRLRLLVDAGADVNTKAGEGYTALHVAAERGDLEMAEFLVAKGANPNAATTSKRTPLHEAVHYSRRESIELLLANGPTSISA